MVSPLRHVVTSRRAILLAGLAGIIALSWVYLVWMERAMYGPDASCPMHTTPDWTLGYAAMTFLMWVVMMIAMMLPSAAPMVIAVETIARTRGRPPTLPWFFVVGYIAVWSGFSAGATAVQWMFHRLAVLAPMDLTVPPSSEASCWWPPAFINGCLTSSRVYSAALRWRFCCRSGAKVLAVPFSWACAMEHSASAAALLSCFCCSLPA